MNLDITEDLQDQDFSVDTPKACQCSRRVSGALPSLAPCPFGSYLRPAGGIVAGQTMAVSVWGPEHKLGIYAAVAEIPPRPDGGLPGPTPFTPQIALALPRWLHGEYAPSLSWQYNLPWGQGI